MTDESLTTVEVAQLTGLSVRQLDYWYKIGLVVPSSQASAGPGTRRKYGLENLVTLLLILHLRRHGWSTQKCRMAVEALQNLMVSSSPTACSILSRREDYYITICMTEEGSTTMREYISADDPAGHIVVERLEAEARNLLARHFSTDQQTAT